MPIRVVNEKQKVEVKNQRQEAVNGHNAQQLNKANRQIEEQGKVIE